MHLATLVIAGLVLAVINRHNWFWFDEWEFVHRDVRPLSVDSLLRPHNEHWSTLPVLVYRALYAVAGLRSYVPYLAVLIATHLALVHLLWRLLLRAGTAPLLATGVGGVFAVLGSGWENLTSAFQIGFIGSLVFIAAGLLVLPISGSFGRRDLAYWVLAICALMCSTIGVPGIVAGGVVALLRRGWRIALLVISVPAVTFAAWYWEYGRHAVTPLSHPSVLLQLPEFVWRGVVADLEGFTGLAGAGAALAFLLVLVAFLERRDVARRHLLTVAMLCAALAFYLITGVGRLPLGGVDSVTSTRYVYVGTAFLLPVVGLALTRAVGASRGLMIAAGVLLAACASQGVAGLVSGFAHWEAERDQTRDTILVAAQMLRDGVQPLASPADSVSVTWAAPLTVSDLEKLVAAGKVPPPPLSVPEGIRDAAAAGLLIGFSDHARLSPGALPVLGDALNVAVAAGPNGCVTLSATAPGPELRLHDATPASLSITNATGGTVGVQYASTAAPTQFVGPRTATLTPETTTVLDIGIAGAPVLILPGGVTQVCGVAGA